MKVIFDHKNGIFDENGNSLLEVLAIQENESSKTMFENGWLPCLSYKKNIWYQTRSSRLKLKPISKRRGKELSKINISYNKDLLNIIERAKAYKKFNLNHLNEYIEFNHFKFFFDDCFCGIVNLVQDIPYYTFMVWDESNKDHSYGTLSFYYLIDKLYNEGHEYLYTSEYYPIFSYKKNLPGFEWWDGKDWTTEDKS